MNSAVTDIGKPPSSNVLGLNSFWVQMGAMVCFTVLLSLVLDFMKVWPQEWIVPIKEWVTRFFTWLDKEAGVGPLKFKTVTRSVAWLLEQPLDWAEYILYRGIKAKQFPAIFWIFGPLIAMAALHNRFGMQKCLLAIAAIWAVMIADNVLLQTGLFQLPATVLDALGVKKLDALPWVVIVAGAGILGHWIGGWKLALFSAGCIGYLAVMGLWRDSMRTFSIVLVSVPFAVVLGLGLGIWVTRSKRAAAIISPMFDIMQATPHMAYLVPVVVLFGAGQVPAMIATVIFAMPPMARCTILGIQTVSSDVVESGRMSGCTPRQLLWKVTLPSSQRVLMLGVNQVVMQTLAMVVIASMVGAQGLGHKLLFSLQQLRLGAAVEQGLAIVLMAVVLDRLTQAYANRAPGELASRETGWKARKHLWLFLGITVAAYLMAQFLPMVEKYPRAYTFTLGRNIDFALRAFSKHAYDYINPVRDFITVYMLIPFRDFFLWLPWTTVVGAVGLAAYWLGGIRTTLLTTALIGVVILITGNWQQGMLTLYLVTSAVILCVLIGVPIGIWATRSDRAARAIMATCDTLQTFPSFIYLIPVIMLLKVGDLSNVIAILAYATVPAVRYTYLGIKRIPDVTIEASIANGTTPLQRLWKVELPIALPEIMLGINQTIMMALAMTAITALIGSSDLGQEIYRALPTADSGRGIMAGLGIAVIGIVADRLIQAWAAERKKQLGIN
ncbi:MAG: ABC transporter permease subunit [Pseudomonadota bacterium]